MRRVDRTGCGGWSRSKHPTTPGAAPTVGAPGATVSAPALGDLPTIGGCPVLPATSAFNQDVSSLPVDPRSTAYLTSIGISAHVHPDFGAADLGQGPGGFGIPYLVVAASQPLVPLTIGPDGFPDESNPGSYPIPLDAPVEGGNDPDGDRHVLVVRQGECRLYELYRAFAGTAGWTADGGAIWNLADGSSPGRKPGWTSADAAGLPILPGLARYDEVAAGAIHHALRMTVSKTQQAYVAPANHWTGDSRDPNLPPMGLRLRMRADYDTSKFTGQSAVIATALKHYGLIVADNGSPWYISGAPSTSWSDDDLNQLKTIPGSAFEVVQTGSVVTP
ncbi:MAG: hypothetical protein REI11_17975 [Patulibacter sp.]|nr:hypothetical protein [Patulibacter sp.]